MRTLSLIVLIIAFAAANADTTFYKVNSAPKLFGDFVGLYNRENIDEDDRQIHYNAFVKNLENLNKLNANDSTATYDITKIADYADEEKKSTANADTILYNVNDAPTLFEAFVRHYNREYIDEDDRQIHYNAFVKNLENINKLNANDPTATYGITKFADYTDEEKKSMGK